MYILPWEPPPFSTAPKVEGIIRFVEPPVLNKLTQIVYSLWMSEKSLWDNADATAIIKIPDASELTDGAIQRQGNLSKGSKVELKITIKPVKKGISKIEANTSFSPASGSQARRSCTNRNISRHVCSGFQALLSTLLQDYEQEQFVGEVAILDK